MAIYLVVALIIAVSALFILNNDADDIPYFEREKYARHDEAKPLDLTIPQF